jgi:miniconductance mechanosensitive channel
MSLLDASGFYYKTKKSKSQPSINTYIQLLKIIIIAGSLILIISIILNQSPWIFFTGIGAISAVLMLVFKDTILGFVSSVQVSTFDMVRIGDWITVPSLGVDGDIMDISINTVKIRNFDKTITTIPTYSLMSHGVQNWRGMQETGGRRIKRSINIDINTIKFCDQALIDTLSNLKYLKEHITRKSQEIEELNTLNNCNKSLPIDGRSLTNIGLYQSYIENYLKNNSSISKELTFLIRQLQPDQYGIPIELYVFTNDTDWVKYEKIQSDIFDHLLAAVPMFELKVFQIISK